MKNYIANETGGWATSTAFIRQSLYKAIETHRRARNDDDLYESLRLLGQVIPPCKPIPQLYTISSTLFPFNSLSLSTFSFPVPRPRPPIFLNSDLSADFSLGTPHPRRSPCTQQLGRTRPHRNGI